MLTASLGLIGLLGPAMLQGAGGPEAAMLVQGGGVVLLVVAAWLVTAEVRSRRQ